MFGAKRLALATCLCITSAYAQDQPFHLGQPMSAAEVSAVDISIEPNGNNLPIGSGTAVEGATVYLGKCIACHGANAASGENMADPLVGGVGSLATDKPLRTVISFWPHATTLFDYVRRAMPLDAPMTLTDDEVYAVSAYILYLGGVIEETHELSAKTLPQVQMPNRDGFQIVWSEPE